MKPQSPALLIGIAYLCQFSALVAAQVANVGGAHTHPSLKVPMKYKRDKETIIG
jgi:hypothetical protein